MTEEKNQEETKEEKKPAENKPEEASDAPKESTESKDEIAEASEEPVATTKEIPELKAGYTVRLHLRVTDGKKARIQIFEGIVLQLAGSTPETRTITVRKESKGFGIEKVVPLMMPGLEKIEVVKKAKTRRGKIFFVRKYKKRLKETLVVEK